jgi:hypothetical protein
MTSTFNGTSSAARSGSRSSRPSAHRHSVERLLPSRVLSGSFECRATFRQHREVCRVGFRSRRFDLINRRPRRSERAAVGYPTQADGRRGRVPSNRSLLETLKPVRITRSHATGMQDPVKDPSSSSSVPEPSREPRLPDSDVASCGDPAPGTGGRQGPRERRRGLPCFAPLCARKANATINQQWNGWSIVRLPRAPATHRSEPTITHGRL